jgi:hypothetical protein
MKLHKLLEDSPLMRLEGETLEADGFNVTIEKIKEVQQGSAKGVIVYGSLDGCPYCERFESKWKDACKSCPKGVFTVKVMMEDIPEHHHSFGTKPRMYPSVYGFVRGKNGRVQRYDYSQDRDRLEEIMGAISAGHTVEPSMGAIEDVYSHESASPMVMMSQFEDSDSGSESDEEEQAMVMEMEIEMEKEMKEEKGKEMKKEKEKTPKPKRRMTKKRGKARNTLSSKKQTRKSKSHKQKHMDTKKRSRK